MNQRAVTTIALGVLIGVVYTLSPLLIVFALVIVPLFAWAVRDVPQPERRWLLAILVLAIALRLAAVGGLFLATNHFSVPFGTFFGDEEYFIKRSWWLRNVALDIPISAADFIYAYDEYGTTLYLWVLSTLHVLFGPSPYGVRLSSILFYMAGAIMLYRLVRPSFGRLASLLGLTLLLFLPSLFTWSVSVLKEPLFFAVMTGLLVMAVKLVRTRSWIARLFLGAGFVAGAYGVQMIRESGFAMVALGTIGGLMLGLLLPRPRLAAAVLLLAAVVLPFAMRKGVVQDRIVTSAHQAAQVHWGHINTPGYTYKTLEGRFYEDRSSIASMSLSEGTSFVIKALVSYVTVPLPWQIQSLAALSFLPEQMLWYGLVVLAPLGCLFAMRRDPFLASMLLMYGLVAAVLVALGSGNVGTLIRHRGLAIPYLIWFSALGASSLVSRARKDTHVDYR